MLLSVGIRESATANNIFVVLKISALIVFIIAGCFLIRPENLHNFNPVGWGMLRPFGGLADYSSSAQPYGIIAVSAFVFFSYIGFDTATTTAEECKRPQLDVPVGVIGALAIGTLVYCATAIVLVGAVPWSQVPIKDPLVYALAPLHAPVLTWVITIGVLAGTTSVALASLLGQSRIFYVMARDRMLPPAVAAVHPRFKTPLVTTMITGVAVAILALIMPLNNLLNLVNIGTLDRILGGLLRRALSAQTPAGAAAQFPGSVRAALSDPGDRLFALSRDLRPLADDLDLVRHRPGRRADLLLRLRLSEIESRRRRAGGGAGRDRGVLLG